MSHDAQWGGKWTGHQTTVSRKESAGIGHQNNWNGHSHAVWGEQHTGHHALNSFNGQITTGYNGHISSHSDSYNGQSSSAAYSHNGQFYPQQSPNGWASSNIMTGQSPCHGQPGTPGYMNRPPPYGKHKKVLS